MLYYTSSRCVEYSSQILRRDAIFALYSHLQSKRSVLRAMQFCRFEDSLLLSILHFPLSSEGFLSYLYLNDILIEFDSVPMLKGFLLHDKKIF